MRHGARRPGRPPAPGGGGEGPVAHPIGPGQQPLGAAALQGVLQGQLQLLAEAPLQLQQGLEQGTIVIPMNKNRRLLKPCAVGKGLRTKVNANIGTSQDTAQLSIELEKLKAAVGAGADAIMDLSCYGKTREFRRTLIEMSPLAEFTETPSST